MIYQNGQHSISFSVFAKYPDLTCFMSTKEAGNMWLRQEFRSTVAAYLAKNKLNREAMVAMEQVHGAQVLAVSRSDAGTVLPDTDGLLTPESHVYLAVNAADCVPLFIYEPRLGIVGTAHAGWKGTLEKLTLHMITAFGQVGASPQDLLVAIGPHIGGCCYTVKKERADRFAVQFRDPRVVYQEEGDWHIDLGMANRIQLLAGGVTESHIDAPIVCTSCQNDRYFSYRRDTRHTFGAMVGIIGRI